MTCRTGSAHRFVQQPPGRGRARQTEAATLVGLIVRLIQIVVHTRLAARLAKAAEPLPFVTNTGLFIAVLSEEGGRPRAKSAPALASAPPLGEQDFGHYCDRLRKSTQAVPRPSPDVRVGILRRTTIPPTGIARLNIPSVNGHHFRLYVRHHHVEHPVITPTKHSVLRVHRKRRHRRQFQCAATPGRVGLDLVVVNDCV